MSSEKVLVTGCAGYIGSLLTQYLILNGYHVYGIDDLLYRNGPALSHLLGHKNFEFHNYDCRDISLYRKELRSADQIIALAAIVGMPACEKNPQLAQTVNYGAIRDLVKELSKDQQIVYPNTNSSYGQSDEVCTEESPFNPISLYAKTKAEAEKIVLDHGNCTVFRLATVFGVSPRMRFDLLVNSLFAELFYNSRVTIFEGHFRRNYVHILDVVRAFAWSLYFPEKFQGIFNFGLPTANLTKLELAQKIVGRIGGLILTGDGKDPDQRDYVISNDKILNAGFTFKHTLEDGFNALSKYCWFFEHADTKKMGNYL